MAMSGYVQDCVRQAAYKGPEGDLYTPVRMGILHISRIVALALVTVFSVIILGLAGHLTSLTESFFGTYFPFAALAIAAAVLTLLTVPILLIIDAVRLGAFTSMVVVELVWLGILWVLWLATGADVASIGFTSNCNFINSDLSTACHEWNAIEAFSLLNFIILLIYWITLLVFSIIGASRGHHVWTNSVKEATFLAPAAGAGATTAPQMQAAAPHQPPVQQQHAPSPVGYPPTPTGQQDQYIHV